MGVRIATFNVSMESGNYTRSKGEKAGIHVLQRELAGGRNSQIHNIAQILQRVRPDVVLLNEFDFIEDESQGVDLFQANYLAKVQAKGLDPLHYPYVYLGPVNTGEPSPYDFNQDGKASGVAEDAWGFGFYPGHYGMVVLSRFPIVADQVRSFRLFRWSDMPGALKPTNPQTQQSWYSDEQWQAFRLPSKALWDIPVEIDGQVAHVLAFHPTPPVFDGPENRNGKRNHDEIRLLADYLAGEGYIYDDAGNRAPFAGQRFVILGDLNASVHSSETLPGTMEQLLEHPLVNGAFTPHSAGGQANAPELPDAAAHTAGWRSRADYVLPSKAGWLVEGGAVFWPAPDEPLHGLVAERSASSDHRLVYLDLTLVPVQ